MSSNAFKAVSLQHADIILLKAAPKKANPSRALTVVTPEPAISATNILLSVKP